MTGLAYPRLALVFPELSRFASSSQYPAGSAWLSLALPCLGVRVMPPRPPPASCGLPLPGDVAFPAVPVWHLLVRAQADGYQRHDSVVPNSSVRTSVLRWPAYGLTEPIHRTDFGSLPDRSKP